MNFWIINVFHILVKTCVNDDSTGDIDGNTCSGYYDVAPVEECGCCDTDSFTASVQCCACGGGNITGVVALHCTIIKGEHKKPSFFKYREVHKVLKKGLKHWNIKKIRALLL